MSNADYTFDLTKLTIRDYALMTRATATNDIYSFLEIVAKAADRDIWVLPFDQITPVCARFADALQSYVEATQDAATPEATKILKRLFGDKSE